MRHLAVDDERFWFRAVAAGEPLPLDDDTGWQPSPDEPAEAVLDLYWWRRSRPPTRRWPDEASCAACPLAETPGGPAAAGRARGHPRQHVITETATHAWYLNAARELLDGPTWMGPDDTRVARGESWYYFDLKKPRAVFDRSVLEEDDLDPLG